ncbi:MAG TPA: 4-hydroxy-tetrahydrodipicolinate synthase [Clostridiales bacterium]|nr:4-hydroxy-tetrahydrodipicolinate synthase [Clostridiales bacterium]
MKRRVFTGSGVAIVTPMNSDGSVNYNKLKELIDFQIEGGTDAIIVCGTTGESATLNHEEHVKVIETAIIHVNGRVPVIAGTGSNDTNYALELSKEAEKLGADALLMVTPYYNKTSQEGLVKHYTYVADRVNTPIILYNVPSRTGTNIKPETYAKLAEHPNIVATKEANGDLSALATTIHLCGDKLDVYSGNDDQIVPILSLGGIGVISVLANVAPGVAHDICQYYIDGDIEASRKLQIDYICLINALFCDVNPIPVKEAMNILGFDVGPVRMPLVGLSEANRNRLINELKAVNLLK